MSKLQALNYVIIASVVEISNVRESGLDVSSTTDKNEKYRKGKIVSFGNLCPKKHFKIFGFIIPFLSKDTISIGQEVLFDNYKSSDLLIDGNSYKTFMYSDLVAIV